MIDFKELRNVVNGSLLENEPMSKHTSYGIGGPALAYITPKDIEDLSSILKFALNNKIPVFFVGSGSNLLVSDAGIDGIVITPAKSLKSLKIEENKITAESGVMLGKLVKESMKRNLTGLESLIGVPGTLGGALVMNAGAFGGEISNYLISAMQERTLVRPQKQVHSLYPFFQVHNFAFLLIQIDHRIVHRRMICHTLLHSFLWLPKQES